MNGHQRGALGRLSAHFQLGILSNGAASYLAMNPTVYRKARILEAAGWTRYRQDLVWEPGRKENQRIVRGFDVDERAFFTIGAY
jgi:hypothetical protein